MNTLLTTPRILTIQSDDPEVIRKGHLLQWLVILLMSMSLVRFFWDLPGVLTKASNAADTLPYVLQFISTLIFGALCFYLIRIGRVVVAVHLFAIILIITFFLLLVTEFSEETGLPYLMLIPVVAVAVLDKIRASMVYAVAVLVAIGIYTAVTGAYTTLDFSFFTLVMVGICVTTWVAVNDLQNTLIQANMLAAESQHKTELLQQRARQLQHSAQMGQRTGISVNLEKLLKETAHLIQEEFDFYHVSIFVLEESSQQLTLKEAVGQTGLLQNAKPYRLSPGDDSIIGWVAANRTARIASDVTDDPLYLAEPLLPDTRSEMALPLITRDQLFGVLDVQSRRVAAFAEEDIAILQIVANQLAVNIDNARLFAQTEMALQETRTLYQYNTLLATTLDVGEIYRRSVRTITLELQVRRCLMLVWEREQNALVTQVGFEYGVGRNKQAGFFWDTLTYHLSEYPQLQQPLTTLETAVYQYNPQAETSEQRILAFYKAATCLTVPMIRGTEPTGLLWLFRDNTQPAFQPAEIQLVQAMANQTAVALSNAQLTSDAHVRIAYLSTINRMSVILSHAPTLKAIFDGARREIMALVPATGMSITLLTKDGQHLNWIYGYEFGHEVDLSDIPPLPLSQGFSGHVIRTREILHINRDDFELHQKLKSLTVGADQATWLGLPMIVSGEIVGVLSVENEESFNERDVELLKIIVGPLGSAIHNFIQLDELQIALEAQSHQRLQLQTAAEVAAAATGVLRLEDLVQKAVDLIQERFVLYYAGLFLVDDDKNEAVLVAGTGQAGQIQVDQGRRLRVGGQSLIGGATGDGVPRITQDVTADKEWLPNPHLPETRSELALPLRVRGLVIGALTAQSKEPHLFTPELIQVLQTLCDQLATAIENARLLARVEARAQRQQTLSQLSARLHQTANVEEIIKIGLHALSNHLDDAHVRLQLGKVSSESSESPTNGQNHGAKET